MACSEVSDFGVSRRTLVVGSEGGPALVEIPSGR